jgi:hypothetical protein
MNKILAKVDNITFKDSINCSLGIQDLIDFDFNISNKKISHLSLNDSKDLVKLYDDRLVFGVQNLTADVGFSYMYVSDPPIFADIGDFDWNIPDLTLLVDMDQSISDDGQMDILINSLVFDIKTWRMTFDGISDMAQVATSFISYVGNVLTNRLSSIVRYAGP